MHTVAWDTFSKTSLLFALGSRPGTVRQVITVNLPHRNRGIKRHASFHDYRDQLMDLLRQHGQEALVGA
jgi:NitT/TauT family transport system ATP-binding protein